MVYSPLRKGEDDVRIFRRVNTEAGETERKKKGGGRAVIPSLTPPLRKGEDDVRIFRRVTTEAGETERKKKGGRRLYGTPAL
jgi:hypothetical protein